MKPRRRLIAVGIVGAAALVVVAFLAVDGGGPWVDAGTVAHVRSEGVVYLKAAEVFVVVDGDSFIGLSAAAPHTEGERVLYCPSSGWFEGQHGEKFDMLGRHTVGPADSGLSQLAVRVHDGRVEVNTSASRDASWTAARAPHPPDGPSCDGDGEAPAEVEPGFASID